MAAASLCASWMTRESWPLTPGCALLPYTLGRRARSASSWACTTCRIRARLGDDLRHDAVGLLEQRQQQVLRLDLAVVISLRELLGGEDRLLPALGEFV